MNEQGGGVIFQTKEKGFPKYLVHKSTHKGKIWQATWFLDNGNPGGHYFFQTKENAVKSIMGEFVEGAPIGRETYFEVQKKGD